MNPLNELLEDTELALEEVGLSNYADNLRKVGSLDGRYRLERAVAVLDGLGPELVRAYVQAGQLARKATSTIKNDAVKYQRDLFTARCYVSALREAVRHTLRGSYMLN